MSDGPYYLFAASLLWFHINQTLKWPRAVDNGGHTFTHYMGRLSAKIINGRHLRGSLQTKLPNKCPNFTSPHTVSSLRKH